MPLEQRPQELHEALERPAFLGDVGGARRAADESREVELLGVRERLQPGRGEEPLGAHPLGIERPLLGGVLAVHGMDRLDVAECQGVAPVAAVPHQREPSPGPEHAVELDQGLALAEPVKRLGAEQEVQALGPEPGRFRGRVDPRDPRVRRRL